MDSVQVGKAVFGKEIYTTLRIEPRTYSYPGRSGNPCSVCWVKKGVGWRELETPGPIDRTPEPPGSAKNLVSFYPLCRLHAKDQSRLTNSRGVRIQESKDIIYRNILKVIRKKKSRNQHSRTHQTIYHGSGGRRLP